MRNRKRLRCFGRAAAKAIERVAVEVEPGVIIIDCEAFGRMMRRRLARRLQRWPRPIVPNDIPTEPSEPAPVLPWRECWRLAIMPRFPEHALRALADALRHGKRTVRQFPIVLPHRPDAEPRAASPIAFLCWKGFNLTTTRQVMRRYGRVVNAARKQLGDAAVESMLEALDEPRAEVWQALADEIEGYKGVFHV